MYDKLGVAEYEAMEVFVNLKEIKHLIKIWVTIFLYFFKYSKNLKFSLLYSKFII